MTNVVDLFPGTHEPEPEQEQPDPIVIRIVLPDPEPTPQPNVTVPGLILALVWGLVAFTVVTALI